MKKFLLVTLLLTTFIYPQLKEMEVKPTENRGGIPIFRDYPDKAAVILYTQFDNLTFYSSYGIHNVMGDPASGKYVVIIEPAKQSLEIRSPGHKSEIIKIESLQPRDVLYYEVLHKKEEGIGSITEISVTIQAQPSDASIFVDGSPMKNDTPTKMTIGNHNLRVEKSGYSPNSQEITVNPNSTLFKVNLTTNDPVPVTISSIPQDAEIFIDGLSKGKTRKALFLYPGTYELRLSMSGYLPVNERITVSQNEKQNNFTYNLVKNTGKLKLEVSPWFASVRINKEVVNANEIQELTPGTYQIEADAETYYSFKGAVEITLGQTKTEKISLSQKVGKLQFTINPPEAESVLSQNGVEKFRWTGLKIFYPIAEGIYDLTAKSQGYKTYTKKVTIKENQTTIEDVQMTSGSDLPEVKPKNTVDINPSYATASSTLPPSYGLSYSPSQAIDNDLSTWWSPNIQYSDHWIKFNFNTPTKIHAIKILNGSHYSNFYYQGVNYGNLYTKNAIITRARLEFSDGTKVTVNFEIYDRMQTVEFPEVTTSFVKLTPVTIDPGSEWPDICISEVKFR
jgi:hypothetical protein